MQLNIPVGRKVSCFGPTTIYLQSATRAYNHYRRVGFLTGFGNQNTQMGQAWASPLPNRSAIITDFYFNMNSKKEPIIFLLFSEREKSVFIQYQHVGLPKIIL